MSQEKIIRYYDAFATDQVASGINERIFSLYRRMKELGLRSSSTVLELGAGIGALSFLLTKTVTKGKIESVDISPESVAFCRRHITGQQIRFEAADIVNYTPGLKEPDFITLFDVIEHIPLERHAALFQNLSAIAGPSTTILINIPNPYYLEYDQVHHPETLQVIDQPVHLDALAANCRQNGLDIENMERCSIWVENDYCFFLIRKQQPFREVFLKDKRNLLQKVLHKLQRSWRQLRYRYP
ncbi:MAG: class I SAM-dependent methyltransferase [Ferruginibacter sp.]